MDIWQLVMTPFSWLLRTFYELIGSYGLALILFSLVTKVILYPLSLKGKRSMIKMNALTAEQQALQRKYGKDQNRYALEVQKMYQRENVSPYGGCLWSMLPMPLLIGLFTIVRSPVSYFMGLGGEATKLIQTAFEGAGILDGTANTYIEIAIAKLLEVPSNLALAKDAVGAELASKLMVIDFNFLGVDLSQTPTWKFWENGLTWAAFGLFLLPVLSALTSFFSTRITMKTNQMNQGTEANPAQNNLMMTLMTPIMSLVFGFIMPAGVSIYWVSNSLFTMLQEIIMGRALKTEYAEAAQRRIEAEEREKEEEKRRKREQAEERARRIEEEKRSKGKKKEKEKPVREGNMEASREGLRAYARGRAYEPNRFGGVTPYGGGAPVPVGEKTSELPTAEEKPEDELPTVDVEVLTEGEVSDDKMD